MEDMEGDIIRTFTLSSSWGVTSLYNPLAVPTWMVSTLLPLYLLYPWLLATLQSHSSPTLASLIVIMYQVLQDKITQL